ncbi:hypothetical protein XENOCAPTIV_019804, partial [Xenoophorus captivus]
SKALRERWLLEGPPTAGPDHDQVRSQLEEDEAKTRNLEESVRRLEQDLLSLETGSVSQPVTHCVEMSAPDPGKLLSLCVVLLLFHLTHVSDQLFRLKVKAQSNWAELSHQVR